MATHILIDLRGNKYSEDGYGKGPAIIKASNKSRCPIRNKSNKQNDDVGTASKEDSYKQAKRGFAAGAVLFDLEGNGVFWQKKGVMLRRLRISKKKEILRKLTVFYDGGNLNCRSSLSRRLASILGPSLLIIELKKDDPLQYMTVAVACTIAHL
jgi:hypothetical protein